MKKTTAKKKTAAKKTTTKKTAPKKTAAKKTAASAPKPELPIVRFATKSAWAQWLDAHHATARGVWLELAKKGAPYTTVTYAEAVDVALCYGWIDGQSKGMGAHSWLQRYTPRGAKSIWSKINREKVAALIAAGAMRPAGLAAVKAAQADGRWDAAYDSPSRAAVPDDLQAELDRDPAAAAFFASLNAANRYAIVFRLQTAKKPETRARRLAQCVQRLRNKEKFYP